MKTQISRYLGTLAIAAALLTSTTSAFAATPGSVNPTLYDDTSEAGDDVAAGLTYGGEALDVGAAIVGAAAGNTEAGQVTSGALSIGGTALTDVAAPIVVLGTR